MIKPLLRLLEKTQIHTSPDIEKYICKSDSYPAKDSRYMSDDRDNL